MDSQQEYEALLAKWGFEDTGAKDYERRQKRARQVKAIVTFFKTAANSVKNVSARPQQLSQANL